MKITLFMAMSLNGIVARENGEEDFLSEKNWDTLFELTKNSGTFVTGRKTYEDVLRTENYDFSDLEAKKIIISRDSNFKADGFEVVGSPEEVVEKLSQEGFKNILVVGGSTINSLFAKKNLLDEVIINIDPVIVGKGIPLFNPDQFDLKLSLVSMKKLDGDRLQMKYKVVKS